MDLRSLGALALALALAGACAGDDAGSSAPTTVDEPPVDRCAMRSPRAYAGDDLFSEEEAVPGQCPSMCETRCDPPPAFSSCAIGSADIGGSSVLGPFDGIHAAFGFDGPFLSNLACRQLRLFVLDASVDLDRFVAATSDNQVTYAYAYIDAPPRALRWGLPLVDTRTTAELHGERTPCSYEAELTAMERLGDWENPDADPENAPAIRGHLRLFDGDGHVVIEGPFTAPYCAGLTRYDSIPD